MSDNKYDIYYVCLKSGVAAEDAIETLAKLPKILQEKAEQVIHSKNRIIKSGLSKKDADRYRFILDKIGLCVEVHDESGKIISNNQAQETGNNVTQKDNDYITVPVEFNGQAFEYFKIWIVNIFLTIITLGIYSAWAKVRNKQYFYGNTIIDGSSFNYTAKPISILKGRLIAVGLFGIYSIVSDLSLMAGLAMLLAFMPAIPWLITRSLAFNARNSVYRNIRFDFKGSYSEAFGIFLLWPLLIILTAGLILPYIWYKQYHFVFNYSAFGTTRFDYHARPKDFYRIFLIAFGALFAVGLLMFVLYLLDQDTMIVASGLVMLPVYILMFGYFTASISNLNFNSTTIKGHHFTSSMQTKTVGWIYFTNTVAIALSLGLMIPWAKIRMARYRAECLQLKVGDSLDTFVAAEQNNISALGDQMGEVFDIEMSII